MHEARRIDKDYNLIASRGYVRSGNQTDAPKIYVEQFICVNKKAVEMLACEDSAPLAALGVNAVPMAAFPLHGR